MSEIITLENGIKVVLEKIDYVRSVSFGVWVKNGSRNEQEKHSGISHFIEHMLFKGTEKRTSKDIADEMDCIGGQLNAFTAKEYTCYYTRTLDTHFDIAIDIISDMFFNSKFDEKDIKKEHKVILEEIDMYDDSPEELVHDILQNKIWPNNPLGTPILGTKETIATFNKKEFEDYIENNYTSDRIVISIAGSFDKDDVLSKVKKYFGSMNKKENKNKLIDAKNYIPSFISKVKDIEQVHLVMGFPSISYKSEDSYVLSLINTVFGGGMSSRLFQRIREKHGLAYSVYSYNSSYTDTGFYSIYAALNPVNTEKAVKAIVDELKLFCSEGITEMELKNTKEQIKSNYLLSLESTSNRMNNIGRSVLILDKVVTAEELVSKIDKISLEDILRVSKQIFNLDILSLSLVGNVSGIDLEDIKKIVK